MCLELKAKHAYSEMNDNIITLKGIIDTLYNDLISILYKEKKIKDTKAINYRKYITFNNCIFS